MALGWPAVSFQTENEPGWVEQRHLQTAKDGGSSNQSKQNKRKGVIQGTIATTRVTRKNNTGPGGQPHVGEEEKEEEEEEDSKKNGRPPTPSQQQKRRRRRTGRRRRR